MGGTRYLTGAERAAWAAWLPAPPCIRTVYDLLVVRAAQRRVSVDAFFAFVKNEYGAPKYVRTKNFLASTKVWDRFDAYLRGLEQAAPIEFNQDLIDFDYDCGMYNSPERAVQAETSTISAAFRCAMALRLELPGYADLCREPARRQLIANPYARQPLAEEFGEEVVKWIMGS